MPSKDPNRVVAHNVRLLRMRLGLSQEDLAEKCGLHRTYVGAIERAERNITLSTLNRLAVALAVSPEELISRQWERKAKN
ncbi:MAG: helix-turn-helix transcriptional regulator [Acidobacteriales bacterium]|nr:helix-turn-helix transcriptional regulator [Terriglobales bacterium]